MGPVVMQCSSVVGGLQMEWVGFARCRHRAAAHPRLHRARFCACARLKTVVRGATPARGVFMSCHVVRRPGREEGDDRISGIGATTPPLLGSDSPSTRSCPGLLPPAVGQKRPCRHARGRFWRDEGREKRLLLSLSVHFPCRR